MKLGVDENEGIHSPIHHTLASITYLCSKCLGFFLFSSTFLWQHHSYLHRCTRTSLRCLFAYPSAKPWSRVDDPHNESLHIQVLASQKTIPADYLAGKLLMLSPFPPKYQRGPESPVGDRHSTVSWSHRTTHHSPRCPPIFVGRY